MEEKVELNKTGHALDILERFNHFRKANKHCDFIIRAGDEEMPVHKCVISASSKYFDAMLSHETQENIQGVVEIKQVDPECVVKCIEFMYTGEASVSEEKRQNLIHVAHMLQLKRLYEGTAVFLEKKLNPSSFFSTREIANMYDCNKLVKVCNEFAFKNFVAIVKLDGFKMLEVDYVKFLLSSKRLKVGDGIKCKALMMWINYDSSRAASLFDLMQHIDFSQLPMTYRRFLTESEPAISNSNECLKHVVKSIFEGGNTIASDFSLDQNQGIMVLDNKSQTLKQFDLRENAWSKVQPLHQSMIGKSNAVVSVQEYIYVFTGDRKTFRLQIRKANSAWERMASRSKCSGVAVVIDEMVYYIDLDNFSTQSERYNTKQDQWSFITSRSSRAADSAVTVLQGKLFYIGGHDLDGFPVSTVEYFNPTNSSWSYATSLHRARNSASATTLNDAIYLLGGLNNSGYLQSLEIYHNTAWTLVNLKGFKRKKFSSDAIGGKIYLVGSKNSNFQTIDEYDPSTGQIQTVTSVSDMDISPLSSVFIKA